jgi:hypothetical protein
MPGAHHGREKRSGKFKRISGTIFELPITPIRLQKHKVGRTFLFTGNCQRQIF